MNKEKTMMLSMWVVLFPMFLALGMAMPDNPNVPPEVLEKFRTKAALKPSWKPDIVQVITPSATSFVIGGRTIYFADLVPLNGILPNDAQILVNGRRQVPEILVYTTAAHPDVRVTLDDRRTFLKATLTDSVTDNTIDLLPISRRTFVEVNAANDIDWDNLETHEMVCDSLCSMSCRLLR